MTAIDSAGRVVIPEAVRDAAHLAPGMTLIITFRDGKVEIEPEPRPVALRKRGVLVVAVPEAPSSLTAASWRPCQEQTAATMQLVSRTNRVTAVLGGGRLGLPRR